MLGTEWETYGRRFAAGRRWYGDWRCDSGYAIRQVGLFLKDTFPKSTDAIDTAVAGGIAGAVDWVKSLASRRGRFRQASPMRPRGAG